MRHDLYRMPREAALDFLRQAPVVHLASVTPDGQPVLRTVHGVVVDDVLAFHGAPVGEKMDTVGQPAVIAAEEIVAQLPSHVLDPERACPATTYYRSVQVHGVIEAVTDPARKAAVLQALMVKFQPEGGYVPITADHPLYAKAVAGVAVLQVRLDRLDGKAKLGQNRRPEERAKILAYLRQRGQPQDLRAIDLILAAIGSRTTTAEQA